jgi:hypothetical protein
MFCNRAQDTINQFYFIATSTTVENADKILRNLQRQQTKSQSDLENYFFSFIKF